MRQQRDPFRCEHPTFKVVENSAADEAELVIYDVIGGWWGVTADQVREQLAGIKAKTIHLRLHSPGGDVFEGMAIYNTLKEHDARVVTHVDGWAASAASVVALAGDEVLMGEGTMWMVHRARLLTMGTAEDLRKDADMVGKVDVSIAGLYQRHTGQTTEQIDSWMEAETWFTAEEALSAGFATGLSYEEAPAAAASALFDLSAFTNVPAALQSGAAPTQPTDREIEQALRDVGLPQIAAKKYVSAGRAALTVQRDAAPSGQRDAASEPDGHKALRSQLRVEMIRAAAQE